MATNIALAETSLDHWTGLTCGSDYACPNGFTFDGASSMSTLLGRRDDAAKYEAHKNHLALVKIIENAFGSDY